MLKSPINRLHPPAPSSSSTLLAAAILLAAGCFAPAARAATGTCSAATGQGSNGPADYSTYCWIDFTNYNATQATSAAGESFTISTPNGGSLSFTLKLSSNTVAAATVPTWAGAAFGQTAFTGVPGKPSLYQNTSGATTTVTLSNIVLSVGTGSVPYAIVAADAESTNNGESLNFITNGDPWTLLATMPNGSSTLYPTLSGTGTTTVTETGVSGTVGAYAFATTGSPTTITSTMVGSGLQGITFGLKFHAADLAIAKTHTGNFNMGGTGRYTLTVTNNGPDAYAAANTITVTDTLPTGLTYPSASGSGWSCSAAGQVVTCTTGVSLASGSSLPAITVNVGVGYTSSTTVTNTATASVLNGYDYNTANNTANDATTLVPPDLSTSSKTVVNTGGGDAVVGSTLQYTITLTESAGVAATNASVTDDVPANLTNFTVVSIPTGATNSSTGAGSGANNDGKLNITGISVPANGSVTVVFTAQVASGTANCTNIDNTAAVTNPYGNGATPSSSTVTVAQSTCASSGNKILYVYDNLQLTRVVQAANTTTPVTINGAGGTATWTMTPVVPTGKSLVLTAGNISATLVMANFNSSTGSTRTVTVELRKNSGTIATSGGINITSATVTARVFTIAVPATTINAGDQLIMVVHVASGAANRQLQVYQQTAGQGNSKLGFATSTVINVDSVTAYSAAYPSTSQPANGVFLPGQTVYICAVISDPFGSADVSSASITLTDPTGTVQVSGAAMSKEAAASCTGTSSTATEAFEYAYTTSFSLPTGFWTASVTGNEGSEGTVTHTANGSFDLDVPSLLIMKTVMISNDPVEGSTRAKAIPGATAQYTITVQNNGRGPVDSGTLVISDPVPANTVLSLSAKPPFTFTDGSTPSGVSVTSGSDGNIVYSNNGGSTYTYVPACARPCTDSTITNFKITLSGSMNGKTGATAPSFTITFNIVIN